MNYKVMIPIDGCESEEEFKLEKLDDFFSTMTGIESGISLKLMSFGAINSLSFEIPQEVQEKLDINSLDDISIFYIFILQHEVSNSSMDITSPIIINKKNKKMAQMHINLDELGLDSLNDILPNFG